VAYILCHTVRLLFQNIIINAPNVNTLLFILNYGKLFMNH